MHRDTDAHPPTYTHPHPHPHPQTGRRRKRNRGIDAHIHIHPHPPTHKQDGGSGSGGGGRGPDVLTGLVLCQQALVLLDAWHEAQQAQRKATAAAAAASTEADDDIVVDDDEEEGEKEKDELGKAGVPALRAAVSKAWRDYAPLRGKLLGQRRQAAGRRPAFLDEVCWCGWVGGWVGVLRGWGW